MKPKIYIFQRTKKQKIEKILIFPTFCLLLENEILLQMVYFLIIRSHIIILQVCTYHDEIVEQFLFEVLGNLIQVVGDEMMVAVDGDTSWQLHKQKKP